jgi:hypothetical protein
VRPEEIPPPDRLVWELPAPRVLAVPPGPGEGWQASEQRVRPEQPAGQRLLEAPVRSADETYLPGEPELLLRRLERRPVEHLAQVLLVSQPQEWRLLEPEQQGSPARERLAERQLPQLVPKWEQQALAH